MRVLKPWGLLFLFLASLACARTGIRFREAAPATHVITEFQTNTSASGTGAASATSPNLLWAGSQSNRLIFGTSTATFQITISPAVNLCADSFLTVMYHVSSKTNATNVNSFIAAMGADLTHFKAYDFGSAVKDTNITHWGGTDKNSWNRANLTIRKFSTTGTYNCAAVGLLVIQATAAAADTVTVGGVYAYPPRIPIATLIPTADDAFLRWFQLGYPLFEALRWHITLFLNSGTIGTAPFASSAVIDSANNRYFLLDFGNHGKAHDTLPIIGLDSTYKLFRDGGIYLQSHGWQNAYNLCAEPYGARNAAEDSMFRFSGLCDFTRGIVSNTEGEPQWFGNPAAIKIHFLLGQGSTLAGMKARLDSIVAAKTTGVILMHDLCQGCVLNSTTWDADTLAAFLTYANTKVTAGTLQVLSLGQYLDRYGGSYSFRRREGFGH